MSQGYSFSDSCQISGNGMSYMGKTSTTVKGYTCQSWDSQIPHKHSYSAKSNFPDKSLSDAKNYCRSPSTEATPWCFTTDPNVRTDKCSIPVCGSVACKLTEQGREYHGKISLTTSGRTCQAWNSQSPHAHQLNSSELFMELNVSFASNYCRNPDGKARPWCFTTDPDKTWEYCDIPLCGAKSNCQTSFRGAEYSGSINVTKSGRQCQAWASEIPHKHSTNDATLAEGTKLAAKNYCRNPTNDKQPWCFTTDPEKKIEFCNVPICGALKPVAAYQSGVLWNKGPEKLIDSDYETNACTNVNLRHYIVLDLGMTVNVTKVRFFVDTPTSTLLNGFEIGVTNTFRQCALGSTIYDIPAANKIENINKKEFDIAISADVGRYLFIRAPNVMSEYLSILEIIPFGSIVKKADQNMPASYINSCELTLQNDGNILVGKKLYFYPNGNFENLATDGNLSTKTSTSKNHHAWIAIDMEQVIKVKFVRLWTNNGNDHATSFSVFVTNKFYPCEVDSPEYISTWKLCKRFENVDLINNQVVDGVCDAPVDGQYIIVIYGTSEDRTVPSRSLSFKEIEAFGSVLTGKPIRKVPELNLLSELPEMNVLMPIRELIMGSVKKIVIPVYTPNIWFAESNSESLLWDTDSKKHLMVATQFGKGRLITSARNEIINDMMTKEEYANAWNAMKSWLGSSNAPLRNITDSFAKGDIVLCIGKNWPNNTQVTKAISMLKSGDISLIFAPSTIRLQNNFINQPEYEICTSTNVIITTQWVNYGERTITLPSIANPDICGLGVEKLLQIASESPQVIMKCPMSFDQMKSILPKIFLNVEEKKFRDLALKALQKYEDFVRFYQPCSANPLSDNTTKLFIRGYNMLLMVPFLKNSGYKAPRVSAFPGDIPSADIVREKVTMRFESGNTQNRESHPTGLYLPAGDTLLFKITNATDADTFVGWRVAIGCHTDDITVRPAWIRFPKISLEVELGLQSVYSPFGGVVRITSSNKMKNATLEITFLNAVRAPFYNSRDSNAETKFEMRQHFPAPWMEFAGDAIIMCIPSRIIRNVSGEHMKMIATKNWDLVVKFGWYNTGIDWRSERRMRITTDIQVSVGLAHSGYPIGAPLSWASESIINDTLFKEGDVWGMFHEIGHNLQRGAWTWNGFGEVTNNVLVLIAQRHLLNMDHEKLNHSALYSKKRIEKDEKYLSNPSYDKLMYDDDDAAFLRLSFFNHIGLCYSWGTFQKVFKRFIDENINPTTDEDKRDQMLILLSEVTGYNLSPIFNYWTIPVTSAAVSNASKFPCIMPDDVYTNMNLARTNEIMTKYGPCSRKCPPPITVTFPDFSETLPNNVFEL